MLKEQQAAVDHFVRELKKGHYVLENTACLICAQNDSKLLYTNDRYGIPSKIVLCRKCGLVYTNPRMYEESAKRFYESDIYRSIYGGIGKKTTDLYQHRFQYNPAKEFNVDAYSTNESFFLFLKESGIHYETVCEIGAGGGWNLIPFIKERKIAIGYEPSQFLVNIGEKRSINIHRGFLEDVSGEFDLVILRHVLEHFNDPLSALRNIRKHTGKYLAVEVPGIVDSIPSIQNAHTVYFSLNTLPKLLSMSGYQICNIVYFRPNNFIMALFEKTNNYNKHSYVYRKEFHSMMRLYNNERIRYLASRTIKWIGLYNFGSSPI